MEKVNFENLIFIVDKEPYCIWGYDLIKKNLDFLNNIDVEYFDYILNVHGASDDENRAPVALQLSYHHALETFFSYLCAYVQSPLCVYSWLEKCSNTQLREIVKNINLNNEILYLNNSLKKITWSEIANKVFDRYCPGTNKQKETIALYSNLWGRFANEFLEQRRIDEYNSMKHGFRIKPGGFNFMVGIEHEFGVPPPDNEMKSMDYSKYGTSFLKLEKIGKSKGNRNLKVRQCRNNWKPERILMLMQLVSSSIKNIVSGLKIENGVKANDVVFTRFSDCDIYIKAWEQQSLIKDLSFKDSFNEEKIPLITKKMLLDEINKIIKGGINGDEENNTND